MVKVGNKIIPKFGSYKDQVCIVQGKGKVMFGRKTLGTKKGLYIYMAAPEDHTVCPAFYNRKDFEVVN